MAARDKVAQGVAAVGVGEHPTRLTAKRMAKVVSAGTALVSAVEDALVSSPDSIYTNKRHWLCPIQRHPATLLHLIRCTLQHTSTKTSTTIILQLPSRQALSQATRLCQWVRHYRQAHRPPLLRDRATQQQATDRHRLHPSRLNGPDSVGYSRGIRRRRHRRPPERGTAQRGRAGLRTVEEVGRSGAAHRSWMNGSTMSEVSGSWGGPMLVSESKFRCTGYLSICLELFSAQFAILIVPC